MEREAMSDTAAPEKRVVLNETLPRSTADGEEESAPFRREATLAASPQLDEIVEEDAQDSEEEGYASAPSAHHIMLPGVTTRMHWGLNRESRKYRIGRILESQPMELLILFLVLCDFSLVSLECGIYHRFLCVNGRMVPGAHLDAPPAQPLPASSHAAHEVLPLPLSVHAAPSALLQLSSTGAVKRLTSETLAVGSDIGGRDNASDSNMATSISKLVASLLSSGAVTQHPHRESEDLVLVCEDRHGPLAGKVMIWCDFFSVAILVAFLIELLLKLWVHPEHFKRSTLHCIDLFVVVLSLFMDMVQMVLHFMDIGVDVKILEMLLVIIRLWRVMRIFHTAFSMWHRANTSSSKKIKEELERAHAKIKLLEEQWRLEVSRESKIIDG